MTSFDVSHLKQLLSGRNSVTGWHNQSFTAETTQETLIFIPKGSQQSLQGLGTYVRTDALGLTLCPVKVDDRYNINGNLYKVNAVREVMHLGGDSLSRREVDLELLPHENLTADTYTEQTLEDPRYRMKVFLESRLDTDYVPRCEAAYRNPPYNLTSVFKMGVDVVYSLGEPSSTPLLDAFHKPYAYHEQVPVYTECIDKSNLDGDRARWQAEAELRKALTNYPYGSLRLLESSRGQNRYAGSTQIYSSMITVDYRRINEEYTPSYPTFSHTLAFTYEGDRTSGGSEGTWTLTQGGGSTCAQSITTDRNLYLNQTVFGADSYTKNGTNLSLSTTVYTTIRWRYKTSGSSTAKIVLEFSDASTQTVLAESSSSTFTVGSTTITSGKTLDHIRLYCCDGVGTVTWDCVQVYGGTYILPNCVSIEPPFMVNDAVIEIPGRMGSVNQVLGSQSLQVTMECDLDLEPSALTWKRPQTETTKTDYNNTDIFYETQQYGAANAQNLWTWLDLGDPTMQFKARLVRVEPVYGEAHRVRLTWREYRHGNASGETPNERFGLSL